MVSLYKEMLPKYIMTPLLKAIHNAKELPLMSTHQAFLIGKFPRGKGNRLQALTRCVLLEDSPNYISTAVCCNYKLLAWLRHNKTWGRSQPRLKLLECPVSLIRPLERHKLFSQMGQRCTILRKVLDELSIKIAHAQEGPNLGLGLWLPIVNYGVNFSRVDMHTMFGYNISKEFNFLQQKLTLG